MISHRGAGERRAPHASARAGRGERGETLVEVLIAVVLMGTVVAGLLGGLFALVKTTNENQERTKVGLVLQSYAEAVKQPVDSLEYKPCTGDGSTQTAAYRTALSNAVGGLLPSGYTATVNVEYWQGGTGFGVCSGTDRGLQRFSITINNGMTGTRNVTETMLVTKRNATCPNQFSNPDAGPC